MFAYYLWALAEKSLSYIPYGEKVYQLAGYLAQRDSKGTGSSFATSLPMARKAKDLLAPGSTVVDVGTGWFHHDAFLLWLVGEYKIHLFDVTDKAKLVYILNYLNYLHNNIDLLVKELHIDKDVSLCKLDTLLRAKARREIYDACHFVPCITNQTDTPFLPENSVDFMVSNCVLGHIHPQILVPELMALRRMLKPDGRMHFMIGHDDHWTFHDPSANQFNYYRYSDKYYSLIFETQFEYQNRLVKQEWLEIFEKCGLGVDEYHAHITEQSREQIAKLLHVDARFAKYPLEELAIIYSYFLLKKK